MSLSAELTFNYHFESDSSPRIALKTMALAVCEGWLLGLDQNWSK